MIRKIPIETPDKYWRPLFYLNIYRLTIAGLLLLSWAVMQKNPSWAEYNTSLFLIAASGYLLSGSTFVAMTKIRKPRFNRQLTVGVISDIAFITSIMYASGGVRSGFGLLLVIAITAASLVSQGRLAIFYAALATIAILLEQTWQLLTWEEPYQDYTHAVMLSLSFFATAWLAHSLAQRSQESEALASQRGIDLANLSEVNQLIIRDMADGVVVVDHLQRLRQTNEQAQELLGIRADLHTLTPLSLCAPQLADQLRDWMSDSPGHEARQLNVSGRELQLRLIPVGSGRELGAVIFVSDLSSLQAQAQQLKLASLGRLTANIAHEIRNPLSAISHAAQLLNEDERSPSQKRLLEIVQSNVQRLDDIVQDVLQLNRRDRAKQERINADIFLQEFSTQFCQTESIPEDVIARHSLDAIPPFLFDRQHLHQVMWNLCRNAWRHCSKTKGSLLFTGGTIRSRAFIDVIDDGPGISKEMRQNLFEPFFTTEANGTGLGLYIARELCEANSAKLEYIDAPAKGTIFRIYARRES